MCAIAVHYLPDLPGHALFVLNAIIRTIGAPPDCAHGTRATVRSA